MFNQVFDNVRQATETTVQMQQEMFKTWLKMWPGLPASAPLRGEKLQEFQKKWAATVGDMLKQQREVTEAQFKAGLQSIDRAFQLGEAKTPEEVRAKSLELWQKCFEDLRQVYETQMHGFEAVVEKWVELASR